MVTIAAVYENGVFRPLEPVSLEEGEQVEVRFVSNGVGERHAPPEPEWDAEAFVREMERIAALGVPNPADRFAGRDHDKILYDELQL